MPPPPSPPPPPRSPIQNSPPKPEEEATTATATATATVSRPRPRPILPAFPELKLRLHANDLSLPGAQRFFQAFEPHEAILNSVEQVLRHLYGDFRKVSTEEQDELAYARDTSAPWPGTRSVTVYLDDMDGVAYTKGSDLDSDHKEIHFSTRFIAARPAEKEIRGVLCHEMVHAWQWTPQENNAPMGLTEGIADWVRLKAGLSPPHWKREPGETWNQGYERTAFFLEWLEGQKGGGKDVVPRINKLLRCKSYDEDEIWVKAVGEKVGKLWKEYVKDFEDKHVDLRKSETRKRIEQSDTKKLDEKSKEVGASMEEEGRKQKEKGEVMIHNGEKMVEKGRMFVKEGDEMIEQGKLLQEDLTR